MIVVVPMAGAGSRFQKAGYVLPKPLVDVNGEPMIRRVIENILPLTSRDDQFVFLVQKEHLERYEQKFIDAFSMVDNYTILRVDGVTEGAACTVLLAKDFIINEPLLIVNSDQIIEYDVDDFNRIRGRGVDIIFTFKASGTKWSYVKFDEHGRVVEVAEKQPISDTATVGVYYFNNGRRFVQSAEEMIEADNRVNGEFYVCPVYNYSIKKNPDVYTFFVKKMSGLGTPEDLHAYLDSS